MHRRRLRRRLSGTSSEGLRKKFAPPRTCVPVPAAGGGGEGSGGGSGNRFANSASEPSRQSGLPVAALAAAAAAPTKRALEPAQGPKASAAANVHTSRGEGASPTASLARETLLRPADVICACKGPRLAVGLQRRKKPKSSLKSKRRDEVDSGDSIQGVQQDSSGPGIISSATMPPGAMSESGMNSRVDCDEDEGGQENGRENSSDAMRAVPLLPKVIQSAPLRQNSKRSVEAPQHQLDSNGPRTQQNPLSLQLPYWGLPPAVCTGYSRQGVSRLYPWQQACLSGAPDVLAGRRHFLYAAPTSGGKTLVAEILLLRRILATGCRALLVLPYNSVVAEKTRYLQALLRDHNHNNSVDPVRVKDISRKSSAYWSRCRAQVGVCTIEKANKLVNFCLRQEREQPHSQPRRKPFSSQLHHEDEKLKRLGVVVIDEFHMVWDAARGGTLEMLVAKLLYCNACSAKSAATECPDRGERRTARPLSSSAGANAQSSFIQIVGMSATFQNLPLLQRWLGAATHISHFRPMQLNHYVILQDKLLQIRRREQSDHESASTTNGPKGTGPPKKRAALIPVSDHTNREDGSSILRIPGHSTTVRKSAFSFSLFGPEPCCQQLRQKFVSQAILKETYIAMLCHETLASKGRNSPGRPFCVRCLTCCQTARHDGTTATRTEEIAFARKQVLVFCGSKTACTKTANLVFKLLKSHGPNAFGDMDRASYVHRMRLGLIQRWKQVCGNDMDATMRQLLLHGIACHHTNFTLEERALIEHGYREGFLRLLFATSTLAVGVNLPATRVIFNDIYVGLRTNFLDATRYQQMAGRAGRTGVQNVSRGESFIVLEHEARDAKQIPSLFEADFLAALPDPEGRRVPSAFASSTASPSSLSPSMSLPVSSSWAESAVPNSQPSVATADAMRLALPPPEPVPRCLAAAAASSAHDLGTASATSHVVGMHETTLQRVVLEVVAIGLVSSREQLREFAQHILPPNGHGTVDATVAAMREAAILCRQKFLEQGASLGLRGDTGKVSATAMSAPSSNGDSTAPMVSEPIEDLRATSFGVGLVVSGIPPENGIALRDRITSACQAFDISSDWHLAFVLTPPDVPFPYWRLCPNFYSVYQRLTVQERQLSSRLGIDVEKLLCWQRNEGCSRKEWARVGDVYRRFYLATALRDIVAEVKTPDMCSRYGMDAGMLQELRAQASAFAGMIATLCHHMRWRAVLSLVARMYVRLKHGGVEQELVPLMRIGNDILDPATARALYDAGIHTIDKLAVVRTREVEHIVAHALPFQSPTDQAATSSKHGHKVLKAKATAISERARRMMAAKKNRNSVQLQRLANEFGLSHLVRCPVERHNASKEEPQSKYETEGLSAAVSRPSQGSAAVAEQHPSVSGNASGFDDDFDEDSFDDFDDALIIGEGIGWADSLDSEPNQSNHIDDGDVPSTLDDVDFEIDTLIELRAYEFADFDPVNGPAHAAAGSAVALMSTARQSRDQSQQPLERPSETQGSAELSGSLWHASTSPPQTLQQEGQLDLSHSHPRKVLLVDFPDRSKSDQASSVDHQGHGSAVSFNIFEKFVARMLTSDAPESLSSSANDGFAISWTLHHELIPDVFWNHEINKQSSAVPAQNCSAISALLHGPFRSWRERYRRVVDTSVTRSLHSSATTSFRNGRPLSFSRHIIAGIALAIKDGAGTTTTFYVRLPRPLPPPFPCCAELRWTEFYVAAASQQVAGQCLDPNELDLIVPVPVSSPSTAHRKWGWPACSQVLSDAHVVWLLVFQFLDFFPRLHCRLGMGHEMSQPAARLALLSRDIAACFYCARALALDRTVRHVFRRLSSLLSPNNTPSAAALLKRVVLDGSLELRDAIVREVFMSAPSTHDTKRIDGTRWLFDLTLAAWLLDPGAMVKRSKSLHKKLAKLRADLEPAEFAVQKEKIIGGMAYLGGLVASHVPRSSLPATLPNLAWCLSQDWQSNGRSVESARMMSHSVAWTESSRRFWRDADNACSQAGARLLLFQSLATSLKRARRWEHFCRIEVPVANVLRTVETNGIGLDRDFLTLVSRRIQDKLLAISNFVAIAANHLTVQADVCARYAIDSSCSRDGPVRVDLLRPRHLLFVARELLGIPGQAAAPTVETALENSLRHSQPANPVRASDETGLSPAGFKSLLLRHAELKNSPIAAFVLEYHVLHGIRCRWVEKLMRCGHYHPQSGQWRVQPHFNQITQTGRVMCKSPNLQAAPKEPMAFWPAQKMSLFEECTSVPASFCDAGLSPDDPAREAEVVSIDKTQALARSLSFANPSSSDHSNNVSKLEARSPRKAIQEFPHVCTATAFVDRVCSTVFCQEKISRAVSSGKTLEFGRENGLTGFGLQGLEASDVRPLADYWSERGFPYSAEHAAKVPQVHVHFPIRFASRNAIERTSTGPISPATATCDSTLSLLVNKAKPSQEDVCLQLTYPADKVFRRLARVSISAVEISLFRKHAPTTGRVDSNSHDNSSTTTASTSLCPWSGKKMSFCVRDFFVAPPGFVLLSVDFSQIEMRILAHLSEDKTLLRAFRAGTDVFRTIAARIARISSHRSAGDTRTFSGSRPDTQRNTACRATSATATGADSVEISAADLAAVTKQERKMAKDICYSILYGSGDMVCACCLFRSDFCDLVLVNHPAVRGLVECISNQMGWSCWVKGRRIEAWRSSWTSKRSKRNVCASVPVSFFVS
eukprot:INCI16242.1.p1 GENE.INCI16242.1~~INCI16242.1.p1  ORF type:complete len:2691 (+),score=375.11 INCI16242.1:205-8277(+)